MNQRIILEELLSFAFRKENYYLSDDDFKDFGESIWEKIEIEDIKDMMIALGILSSNIEKMIVELKEEYEEDINEQS